MTDIFAEMEADALEAGADSVTTDQKLKGISGLIQQMMQYEDMLVLAEQQVTELKASLQRISTQTIPDAVADGDLLSEFTTIDGLKVSIKPFVGASITEARKEEAHQWLMDNEFGDLIKNLITVDAGKNPGRAKVVTDALEAMNVPFNRKESVHVGTLKAWLREQVEAGTPVPLELFGAYLGQKTTIKRT